MFVEVVNMTNNTQFKTLVNTWLNQKQPMITPSTHASFTLIAENHLIPYFGKRKIGSITETDIQSYISYLHDAGRLDKTGGLTVKTIRDVILVLRLSMEFAYKERAIPLLNWDLIEYPKELGIKKVVSLSKDQEQALIQCIYMNLNRKTAGILIALFTGVRIGELCGLQMKDISLTDIPHDLVLRGLTLHGRLCTFWNPDIIYRVHADLPWKLLTDNGMAEDHAVHDLLFLDRALCIALILHQLQMVLHIC